MYIIRSANVLPGRWKPTEEFRSTECPVESEIATCAMSLQVCCSRQTPRLGACTVSVMVNRYCVLCNGPTWIFYRRGTWQLRCAIGGTRLFQLLLDTKTTAFLKKMINRKTRVVILTFRVLGQLKQVIGDEFCIQSRAGRKSWLPKRTIHLGRWAQDNGQNRKQPIKSK